MILRLEAENFYSIRVRQSVDLRVSTGAKDVSQRLLEMPDGQTRAPAVVGFFGANGSGKSNFLRALWFVTSFARSSYGWGVKNSLPFLRFNDADGINSPTFLAVEFPGPADPSDPFSGERTIYRYEVKFTGRPSAVESERLAYRSPQSNRWARLFDRAANEVTSSAIFAFASYQKIVTNTLRSNASLISTLAQAKHPLCTWLATAATNVGSNIAIAKWEGSDEDAAEQYIARPELLDALNREIVRLDIGVREVSIEAPPPGDPLQPQEQPRIDFKHEGHIMPLNIVFESHGTRQFFRIFPIIKSALDSGGIAILDELDSSIHPLLLPQIVNWFYDSERNTKGAQLWMSCQAASLLEDLSKEEIYFCEKDHLGATEVYGLRDMDSVRRNDNFYRKYLDGAYGAVPRLN